MKKFSYHKDLLGISYSIFEQAGFEEISKKEAVDFLYSALKSKKLENFVGDAFLSFCLDEFLEIPPKVTDKMIELFSEDDLWNLVTSFYNIDKLFGHFLDQYYDEVIDFVKNNYEK